MPDIGVCPACESELIQPLRSEAREDGGIVVDLRCPECFAWRRTPCSRDELAALDRRQAASREALVSAYERLVAESMEAMGTCLGTALALDLIGPDDFARKAA